MQPIVRTAVSPPLTARDLAAIPDTTVRAMKDALERGNSAYLRELTDSIETEEPETARRLALLVQKYDYTTLDQLLQQRMTGES